jgi:hypothetical protein
MWVVMRLFKSFYDDWRSHDKGTDKGFYIKNQPGKSQWTDTDIDGYVRDLYQRFGFVL